MERPVTERHNGAARILLCSIIKGRHGAGLVQADVGSEEKIVAAGLPYKGTNVPSSLFPASWTEKELKAAQKRLKPDAIVKVKGRGGQEVVHIVEVKYCRDTDRSQQEQRAEQQHQELCEAIEGAGHTIKRSTILIGVGGTVYKDTLQTLIDLGVDRKEARQALEEVHLYTVRQVHRVLKIRRLKEAARRQELELPAWPDRKAKRQQGGARRQRWASRRQGTVGKRSRQDAAGVRAEHRGQPRAAGSKRHQAAALGRKGQGVGGAGEKRRQPEEASHAAGGRKRRPAEQGEGKRRRVAQSAAAEGRRTKPANGNKRRHQTAAGTNKAKRRKTGTGGPIDSKRKAAPPLQGSSNHRKRRRF